MLDIFSGINDWIEQKKPFALATVIHTWGSAPRLVGSAMAVSEDMEIIGSVSGGCVEGAVMKKALEVLETGVPQRLRYGIKNEDAWTVGLSCGGKLQVFVERFMGYDDRTSEKAVAQAITQSIRNNQGCVLLSDMSGEKSNHLVVFPDGKTEGMASHASLEELAMTAYKTRKNQIAEWEGKEYFVQVFPPQNQMLIIGAAHITVELVQQAKLFGFETVVIDPRGIFTNKTQFVTPPDQMFDQWPADVLPDFQLDDYTFVVILSHDPKIDDQALHILLRSEVAYIGALGSSRTHAKRVSRLEKTGFTTEEIDRIHGPIGVDIHAKRPQEIALSIMAQIIQVKNQYL